MKEEKRNIYVLNDYNAYNDSGDIIEVSPEDFSHKYPTILHPRLIIMPVQADPAGITQYVRIRNENLIYFFKKARIQYQLKIEYFYDEEVEPIILDPIKLEITNPSQLYQALWNIERIRFLFSIMDNGKDNENGPGSLGINGDTIRILDVCSFKIDIIGSNQGDIHYEYYERKENTKGRYLIADEIMNQLLHTSFMYDPSNSFQYMEAIACDFDNMQWLFTESLCDIEDFDALFPSENGACIFCKPQDYQYLESFTQKRKRENFYDPCLSGDIVIFDSSKKNGRNRVTLANPEELESWQDIAIDSFVEILKNEKMPIDKSVSEHMNKMLEKLALDHDALYTVSDTLSALYNRNHKKGSAKDKIVIANSLAKRFELSKEDTDKLKVAILLYDIGNMLLPKEILQKRTPLTDNEIKMIKSHPVIAAKDILKPISVVQDIIPIIEHHHENWDGSGYPGNVSGQDIPLCSQMVLIIDAYFALIEPRPYRQAKTKNEAIAIIRDGIDKKWNAKIAEEFISIITTDSQG